MTNCTTCANGGYHGFRRDGRPSTVYFWCPIAGDHRSHRLEDCPDYIKGTPTWYDKRGERFER